jgi:hypothetical protein
MTTALLEAGDPAQEIYDEPPDFFEGWDNDGEDHTYGDEGGDYGYEPEFSVDDWEADAEALGWGRLGEEG